MLHQRWVLYNRLVLYRVLMHHSLGFSLPGAPFLLTHSLTYRLYEPRRSRPRASRPMKRMTTAGTTTSRTMEIFRWSAVRSGMHMTESLVVTRLWASRQEQFCTHIASQKHSLREWGAFGKSKASQPSCSKPHRLMAWAPFSCQGFRGIHRGFCMLQAAKSLSHQPHRPGLFVCLYVVRL